MSTLFSLTELESNDPKRRPGSRLQRLEVYNWGTFDEKVWTFDLGGRNGLLTGDIGSGKSTLVDAITTLLLPSNRVAYNKAAGAATKERNLRSYVEGHYKSESLEESGGSRPIGLRNQQHFSVILGVFGNEDFDSSVTLAQVFRTRAADAGQPERFYVVANQELSISKHFSNFGTELGGLRRQLRGIGAHIHDSFPPYGIEFRRQLGIESAQALDLFHQTVSMKAVDNLNDFVRTHMLEPFDTLGRITTLIAHFDDLTKAHAAVIRARSQLELLTPLITNLNEYADVTNQLELLLAQLKALPLVFALQKLSLLDAHRSDLAVQLERLEKELAGVALEVSELKQTVEALNAEIAGNGGDRIVVLETEIARLLSETTRRRERAVKLQAILLDVGLAPVGSHNEFEIRHAEVGEHTELIEVEQSELLNEMTELKFAGLQMKTEATEVNEELQSLESRRSNLPKRSLDVRDRLCHELELNQDDLPFVGELIQVKNDAALWEGAVERVLHGFALSLLVPRRSYPEVAAWIDSHHIGARLVYFQVVDSVRDPAILERRVRFEYLVDKLDVKPDTVFASWLETELTSRANHLCVDGASDFNSARKAVTMAGQIKDRQRHEKDDRRQIGDRRNYVLGWSNEQKIEALIEQANELRKRMQANDDLVKALDIKSRAVAKQLQSIGRLADYQQWDEVDWRSSTAEAASLQTDLDALKATSDVLAALMTQREQQLVALAEVDNTYTALIGRQGGLNAKLQDADGSIDRVRKRIRQERTNAADLNITDLSGAEGHITDLEDAELEGLVVELDAASTSAIRQDGLNLLTIDDAERALVSRLSNKSDGTRSKQQGALARSERGMQNFRSVYPQETLELDSTVRSATEYRELHGRILDDDLPRFEDEFKDSLNKNTIREIAQFSAQMHKHEAQIRDRVDLINQSLTEIDFNPGRYIRLQAERTPNREVIRFIEDLRACTDDMLDSSTTASSSNIAGSGDQYSEGRFLRVKAIVDRFKGREGSVDLDKTWTKRVTDVRQWFVFSASERYRDTDVEYENYTDSGGKSGGQKEKLAYTILAASLAYQFRLDWGAAKSTAFRFVVIDEAFGRGSESSTRYALSLFTRLSLQMLIVTPLQKIHVIEPHVSAVGFVDNLEGNYSRLQTMTIDEFRSKRLSRPSR